MQLICCDRLAARQQLSYEVQAPLQSVISAANGLLSHDMSAWPQSVSSVCQLSCNMAVQLRYVSSAQLLSEGSVATRQVGCQLSCDLSAQIKLVISPATGWLSCSLSPLLCSAFLVAVCQLSCNMSCSHRSAESQEHNPDPGPDPGLTRVRPGPDSNLP